MELTPAVLLAMVRDTIRAPRDGAQAIMRIGFSPAIGWMALLLMAVASTLLTHLSFAMMPAEAQDVWAAAMTSPVRTAIMQWVVLLISVHAIHKVGRWRGGKGSLDQTVLLVAWLQFILLCVQIVQLVVQTLVPPMSDLVGLLGLVLFFWLLTNFVATLHGFQSLALTFVGILITLFAAATILAFIFALIFGAAPAGV
ncbi:YIP1 family protein [Pseudorhodobacter sp. E13]|uniref:Yip1 family protein n=1 Tax=Pseudorhodobacter sp. E13 TaxID=2487931 RepID=UPI000F8E1A84|nr:Yip1 family protein [Pseudorhodobacter sp. E13]RUS64980.1 YIP1 family protein [Pseudorhodobacter sp. E13]